MNSINGDDIEIQFDEDKYSIDSSEIESAIAEIKVVLDKWKN
jgi:hypothetical protein